MSVRFIFFLFIIYGSLLIGYGVRRLFPPSAGWSKKITLFILVFLTPLIILNAFWSLELADIHAKTLPLILVAVQTLTFIPALLLSRILRLDGKSAGSLVSCSVFSNIGFTIGGFLCFILYGDRGLYLASWYATLYLPYYYLIGFPLMGRISEGNHVTLLDAGRRLIGTPASLVPICVMCIGILLNISGVKRPEILNTVTTGYLSYVTVAGYSFAIGLGLNVLRSIKYIRHALFVALIKFAYIPLVTTGLLFLFGYHRMEDLLPFRIVFIESFMPSAIMGLVLIKVFDLNEDLGNAAWFLTTFLVIPVIPAMFYLQGLFL